MTFGHLNAFTSRMVHPFAHLTSGSSFLTTLKSSAQPGDGLGFRSRLARARAMPGRAAAVGPAATRTSPASSSSFVPARSRVIHRPTVEVESSEAAVTPSRPARSRVIRNSTVAVESSEAAVTPSHPTRSRGNQPDPVAAPEQAAPDRPVRSAGGFEDVPESARYPLGPYRQAPSEFGGKWWLVSPFTGETPWAAEFPGAVPSGDHAPADFVAVFGERPTRAGGAAQLSWDQDLKHFRGVGIPEGLSPEQVAAAGDVFEEWGLGRPVFVEGRYGWSAYFPDSQVEGFQAKPFTAVQAPHLVVARYQIRMSQQGDNPVERHPFVPPQVFGLDPLPPVLNVDS